MDLGFYPAKGKVEIRLTAAPGNESQIDRVLETLRSLLYEFTTK